MHLCVFMYLCICVGMCMERLEVDIWVFLTTSHLNFWDRSLSELEACQLA